MAEMASLDYPTLVSPSVDHPSTAYTLRPLASSLSIRVSHSKSPPSSVTFVTASVDPTLPSGL